MPNTKPTTSYAADVAERLRDALIEKQGGFDRRNPFMGKIAQRSGASVHTLQSVAMGRRGLSPSMARAVGRALAALRVGRKKPAQ